MCIKPCRCRKCRLVLRNQNTEIGNQENWEELLLVLKENEDEEFEEPMEYPAGDVPQAAGYMCLECSGMVGVRRYRGQCVIR